MSDIEMQELRGELANIRAYLNGTADPATAAAMEAAAMQPDSHLRQYIEWSSDPAAYKRTHGKPPDVLLQMMADLPQATIDGLARLGQNLPGTFGVGDEAGSTPKEHKKSIGEASMRIKPARPRGMREGPGRFLGSDERSDEFPKTSR